MKNTMRLLCILLSLLMISTLASCDRADGGRHGVTTTAQETEEPTSSTTTNSPTTSSGTPSSPSTTTSATTTTTPEPDEPTEPVDYITLFERGMLDVPTYMMVRNATQDVWTKPSSEDGAQSATLLSIGDEILVISMANIGGESWAMVKNIPGDPVNSIYFVPTSALIAVAQLDNTSLPVMIAAFNFEACSPAEIKAVSSALDTPFIPVRTMPILDEETAVGVLAAGKVVAVFAKGVGALDDWCIIRYEEPGLEAGYYYFVLYDSLVSYSVGGSGGAGNDGHTKPY